MAISAKQIIPPFDARHLEAIAKVLGETSVGLTGPEIGRLLADSRIADPTPEMTKWKRLYNALLTFQNKHQVGNHVIVFICRAMNPASYLDNPQRFQAQRHNLNAVLAFCGLELTDGGKVKRAAKATSIDEALERANRFQAALKNRDVHEDVLRYCTAEILAQNYFHAVFEAMKSITAKIRTVAGLSSDGAELAQQAFGAGKATLPLAAINALDTDTLKGEQRGFVSLLIGLYGTIRNPLAHSPKVEWEMTEQDALDILTMISLVHRKLDKAQLIPRP